MSDILTAPDAEATVLGAILADPATITQAESLIQPRHMASERHATIYTAILSLAERGAAVDLVTVKDELQRAGALERAGGAAFLASLIDGVPRISSIEHWARMVRERARRRAALEAARRFVQAAEQTAEDTDELIDTLRSNLERLTAAGDKGIQPLREVVDAAVRELEEFVASPKGLTGISTGLTDLDRITGGIKPGRLWIIGAFTSRGKSSLCMQLARQAAQDGKAVLVFSMEMPPIEVAERMVLSKAGLDRWTLRAQQDSGWPKIAKAAGALSPLPLHFDPRETPTATEVRTAAQRHKTTHGCDLIVVDHLQRMAKDPKAAGDDWLNVGMNCQALKSLARRLNVPVVAACQLNAEAEDVRPKMGHLSRARQIIAQESDVIAFIWPDQKEWPELSNPRPSVRLLVEKNRGGSLGEVATVFERAITRFFGVADETEWRN